MFSSKLSKSPPVRSPTLGSSTELTSPTTLASPKLGGRARRSSSGVEAFPPLDSDGTSSPVDTVPHIPQTTLLSSSAQSQQRRQKAPNKADVNTEARGGTKQALQSQSDRTDALWAEMQATLADVELSASRGTHFFGSNHGAALEELRKAQMALAQAWARGEKGDGNEVSDDDDAGRSKKQSGSADSDSNRSPGASVKDGGDLADADVEAARKRREANDRYFSRIERGVVDVVDKLEGVAQAMDKVERESREIWSSESEDLDSSSISAR